MKDGRPPGEVANLNDATRPLRALYGHTLACDFGPKALKAVQHHMIHEERLCRNAINGRVNRMRRIFKWAVGEELAPPAVFEGLRAVSGLRYGRCGARETQPVGPVNDAWVDATIRFLAPRVADIVRLQRLTSPSFTTGSTNGASRARPGCMRTYLAASSIRSRPLESCRSRAARHPRHGDQSEHQHCADDDPTASDDLR